MSGEALSGNKPTEVPIEEALGSHARGLSTAFMDGGTCRNNQNIDFLNIDRANLDEATPVCLGKCPVRDECE